MTQPYCGPNNIENRAGMATFKLKNVKNNYIENVEKLDQLNVDEIV